MYGLVSYKSGFHSVIQPVYRLNFSEKKKLNYGTKEASLTMQNITLFSQVTIPRWDKWNDWDIFGNSTLEKQHAFERQEGD